MCRVVSCVVCAARAEAVLGEFDLEEGVAQAPSQALGDRIEPHLAAPLQICLRNTAQPPFTLSLATTPHTHTRTLHTLAAHAHKDAAHAHRTRTFVVMRRRKRRQ
jgi:hypothetical protein